MTHTQEKSSGKQAHREAQRNGGLDVMSREKRGETGRNGEFAFSKPVHFLFFLLLIALLTLIHSPMALRLPYLPEVGEIASRNIKADRDLLIEDRSTTTQRRKQAAAAILPVYDWDTGMLELIIFQLEESLAWLDPARYEQDAAVSLYGNLSQEASDTSAQQPPVSARSVPQRDTLKADDTSAHDPPLSARSPDVPGAVPQRDTLKADDSSAHDPPVSARSPDVPDVPRRDIRRDAFVSGLEGQVLEGAYQALLALPHTTKLTRAIHDWLTSLDQPLVVESPNVLRVLADTPFYVIRSALDGSEKQMTGTVGLRDLPGLRQLLGETITPRMQAFAPEIQQWLLDEVRTQIRPNLILNTTETAARRKLAYNAVEPVFFQARVGQMVVREGAVVTSAARMKLEAMHQNQWTDAVLWRLLGLAITLGSLLWLGRWFLLKTSKVFPRDPKIFYLLGTILLIVSLLSIVTFALGQGMMELLDWPPHMVVYLPEAALGAALASLMVGARVGIPGGAVIIGAILAFLSALVTNGGLSLFAYFMAGSLAGAASLRTCRRRSDVLYCGLKIGMVQMLAMPVVEILSGNPPSWYWLVGAAMAMSSGLMVGLWGLGLIPLLESLFNITTDSRLAELASGDHPLLRELSLRSPGTYHHSVMMGNLAEAAAEGVHANPLLARVMALYHDIGKMHSPHYFVENQSGDNRHDHLAPSMSTKVIFAHVKGGLELARKHKLGALIQEAIATHHGTSLLQYFYNRASSQAVARHETVTDAEFRYPGPKPHSREAGILMLADSVEAAARTLKTPVPSQIQALVKRIIDAKIRDGQLDECGLTLQEMARIKEAFTRVLTLGFYHRRIEYPDQTGASTPKKSPREPCQR